MRRRGPESGMVYLMVAVTASLVLAASITVMMAQTRDQWRRSLQRYRTSAAARIPQSDLLDLLARVAEDHSLPRYDPAIYQRTVGVYASNFQGLVSALPSEIEASVSRPHRSVSLRVVGGGSRWTIGRQATNSVLVSRSLRGVIQFNNDAFRFGLVFQNPAAIGAASPLNASSLPPVWARGDLNVSGAQLTFGRSPVVVQGAFTGGPLTTLSPGVKLAHGTGFEGGGGTYPGSVVNLPSRLTVLEPDLKAYTLSSDYGVSVNSTWTLTQVGPACRCTWGPGPSDYWDLVSNSTGGPLLMVMDANLWLSGQCSNRATFAAYSLDPAKGNITLTGDVGQTPLGPLETQWSGPEAAVAVMASNDLIFAKGGAQWAYGYYYGRRALVTDDGLGNVTDLTLRGTLHVVLSVDSGGPGNRLTVQHDPLLKTQLPPRVPERPELVSYLHRQ